jgi:hypothetical protein
MSGNRGHLFLKKIKTHKSQAGGIGIFEISLRRARMSYALESVAESGSSCIAA